MDGAEDGQELRDNNPDSDQRRRRLTETEREAPLWSYVRGGNGPTTFTHRRACTHVPGVCEAD